MSAFNGGRPQQGHRGRTSTSVRARRIRSVVMEFGMWRCDNTAAPHRPSGCLSSGQAQAQAFGKPVSSMIQAWIGSLRAIVGSTRSRTRISTARSDHGASATRWSSDWCCAAVRSGAVTAANGPTLFRPSAESSPTQEFLERSDPVGMAQHRCQLDRIRSKALSRATPVVTIHTFSLRLESPLLPNCDRVAASGNCRIASAICDLVGLGGLRPAAPCRR